MAFTFNIPAWHGAAMRITEVWRLRKGRHTAVCSLWNHPTRKAEPRWTPKTGH
jgi:hypothetical protein